ncbi:uncharacterized protein EDB91DRAFT_1245248 [Suillus paluster]|uniref:uncharacterized protein n=1 Tax=Suillus paluster TaxID=48578 RepID=UPI001B880EF8|nr:uncharacterized protein EDB91DRAFT_1245248 [Suillus paluster]KAG1747758.1 hypothetical protein EDB91DRAFT_1245248 [Suillus paluster]
MTKKMNWYQLKTQPTAQNLMLMNGASPIPTSHCHQSSSLGPADSDGEESRPRSSKQHHPASASVHHDDEDQPPHPKPKPKPKPRCTTRDEHEDSVGELVAEQLGMIGESRPATAPVPPHTSSPLSDLTDNDNNFTPPPLTQPSKQKGKKKATTALDAPQRTSGRRKNGY